MGIISAFNKLAAAIIPPDPKEEIEEGWIDTAADQEVSTGIDALTDDWVDLGYEIKWLKGIKPATIIGFYKAKNGRIPEMGDPVQKEQMKKICKFIGVNFEQCEQLLLADLAKWATR